jgi:hypothetical protein
MDRNTILTTKEIQTWRSRQLHRCAIQKATINANQEPGSSSGPQHIAAQRAVYVQIEHMFWICTPDSLGSSQLLDTIATF